MMEKLKLFCELFLLHAFILTHLCWDFVETVFFLLLFFVVVFLHNTDQMVESGNISDHIYTCI